MLLKPTAKLRPSLRDEEGRASRANRVVMGIEMARVDGLSATRQIISAFPRARIAILTQHDEPALRQAAREAGSLAYLTKAGLTGLRRTLASELWFSSHSIFQFK